VNFYLAAPPFRLGTTALGLIFVVYLIGAVVTPVAGRAIDRIGHRFTLVAAFLGGVGGICLTLVPHLPAVLLGLALTSTGVFIAQSAASSYVGRLAEGARGAAVGLYVMFYYTGGSFGAAVPGTFWNRGGWPATVALIAAVQVLTIALCLLFWKPAAAGPGNEPYAAGQVG
jgi:MFS family permease